MGRHEVFFNCILTKSLKCNTLGGKNARVVVVVGGGGGGVFLCLLFFLLP